MALPKAIQEKLNARKSEYEYDSDELNSKLAFATQTYYQGLPELGSHTTTHSKLFLAFHNILDLLNAVKNDYSKFKVNQNYTRARDGIYRLCLDKPAR